MVMMFVRHAVAAFETWRQVFDGRCQVNEHTAD